MEECTICFNELEQIIKLDCCHAFCKKCLEQWIKNDIFCPICCQIIFPQSNEKDYEILFRDRIFRSNYFYDIFITVIQLQLPLKSSYEYQKKREFRRIVDVEVQLYSRNFETEIEKCRQKYNKQVFYFTYFLSGKIIRDILQIHKKLTSNSIRKLRDFSFSKLFLLEIDYFQNIYELKNEKEKNRIEMISKFKKKSNEIKIKCENDRFSKILKKYFLISENCRIHLRVTIDNKLVKVSNKREKNYFEIGLLNYVKNKNTAPYTGKLLREKLLFLEKVHEKIPDENFSLLLIHCRKIIEDIIEKKIEFQGAQNRLKWNKLVEKIETICKLY